jgi:hypothetical protein
MLNQYCRFPKWQAVVVGVLVGTAIFTVFGALFFALFQFIAAHYRPGPEISVARWIMNSAIRGAIVGLLTSIYLDLFKPPYSFHWLAGAVALQCYVIGTASFGFIEWYLSDSSILIAAILLGVFGYWVSNMVVFGAAAMFTGLLITPIANRLPTKINS